MPQRKSSSRGTVSRLALFALIGWALVVLSRNRAGEPADQEAPMSRVLDRPDGEPAVARVDDRPRRLRSRRQRLATSLAFATLFFAGAAFSAGAGDMLVEAAESGDAPAATTTDGDGAAENPADDATTEDPSDGDESGSDEPTETDPGDGEPAPDDDPADDDSDPPSEDEPDADDDPPGDGSGGGQGDDGENGNGGTGDDDDGRNEGKPADDSKADKPSAPPLVAEDAGKQPALDPEAGALGSAATVWLHRTLPDPTPPARRLAPAFARELAEEARRARVDWALVLAELRAEGDYGRRPAGRAELRQVAKRLHALVQGSGEWEAFLAMSGRTAFADRAMALTRLHRAVGLRALVTGLEAARKHLTEVTLADERLEIYAGGRGDLAAGRIDVRVVVLLRYLAESFGTVTVSSLQTGHRLYARPGVVSAHIYGLAVDIAALGGSPIVGNSAPGGLTERAVRDILLLPAGLRPQQLISLLGLGGPSFPMANHADHIHAGF